MQDPSHPTCAHHFTTQQAAMHDRNGNVFFRSVPALSTSELLRVYIIFIYSKKEVVYCYMSAKVEVEENISIAVLEVLVMFLPPPPLAFLTSVNTIKAPMQGTVSICCFFVERGPKLYPTNIEKQNRSTFCLQLQSVWTFFANGG